jgi:hypothetical protein
MTGTTNSEKNVTIERYILHMQVLLEYCHCNHVQWSSDDISCESCDLIVNMCSGPLMTSVVSHVTSL